MWNGANFNECGVIYHNVIFDSTWIYICKTFLAHVTQPLVCMYAKLDNIHPHTLTSLTNKQILTCCVHHNTILIRYINNIIINMSSENSWRLFQTACSWIVVTLHCYRLPRSQVLGGLTIWTAYRERLGLIIDPWASTLRPLATIKSFQNKQFWPLRLLGKSSSGDEIPERDVTCIVLYDYLFTTLPWQTPVLPVRNIFK